MGPSADGESATGAGEGRRGSDVGIARGPDPLETRLRRFAEEARRFSREFSQASGSPFIRDPVRSATRNVELTKSLFAKWSIEILFALYALHELGFQELKDTMGSITPRVLSQRLRSLEDRGLVERKVLPTRPTRVHYSLTEDGLLLARLGEPVFLFLKHRHEQRSAVPGRSPRAAARPRLPRRTPAPALPPPPG
jgi:DNA-binding HxlR family transcriptional regulator